MKPRLDVPRLQQRVAIAALLLPLLAGGASAQATTRWNIQSNSSLAWWQVNPHMNHLWATSCPREPSWRPGEGRSGGWTIGSIRPPKHGYAAVSDTTIVPLYPRRRVRAVCGDAVQGFVTVDDTVNFSGASGEVIVDANSLITGEDNRDAYARESVLQTTRYKYIRFKLEKLTNMRRKGDTLIGFAEGTFTLREVSKPVRSSVKAWWEAGGLRVTGKFHIPAEDLVPVYGISKFALGLGVATRVWEHLFMGVDLLLRPEGAEPTRDEDSGSSSRTGS
jgi:hypothetical protein